MIAINDPRLIKYDSVAALAITIGFVFWGLYLAWKLTKIRTLGPAYRYAIATGNILWLPVEAFSRWGLYPEIWVKPVEYAIPMALIAAAFLWGIALIFNTDRQRMANAAVEI